MRDLSINVHSFKLAIVCPDCDNIIDVKGINAICSQCDLKLRVRYANIVDTEDKKGFEFYFVEDLQNEMQVD